MADNEPHNLIIDHLRAIRGDLADLKSAMHELQLQMNSTRRDLHTLHGDVLRHDERFARLELRLDKIDTRLGLVDA